MSNEDKIAYSDALLANSVSRRSIIACPLAFGAVSVKERVRSILDYKKPAFWVIVVAVIASSALAVFFLTDPKSEQETTPLAPSLTDTGNTETTLTTEQSGADKESLATTEREVPELKEGAIYHAARNIYQNPLSSFYGEDSGYEYVVIKDHIMVRRKDSDLVEKMIPIRDRNWQKFPYSEAEWEQLLMGFEFNQQLNLDSYQSKLYLPQKSGQDQTMSDVLCMDGELWIASFSEESWRGRFIWDIYALKQVGTEDMSKSTPKLEPGQRF